MLAGRTAVLSRLSRTCKVRNSTANTRAAWSASRTSLLLPVWRLLSRPASSSTSRWLARQNRDPFTRATKLNALKSRAAYKLLEIDQKHHIFKPGQTVVDLGYAPGSWSQVAISRVKPAGSKSAERNGRVIGIDVIPAQPPRGVSTIQGDFLSSETRARVIEFVRDPLAGRAPLRSNFSWRDDDTEEEEDIPDEAEADELDSASKSATQTRLQEHSLQDEQAGRVVDVVLSDMSEPWPLSLPHANSVINPYRRMMNTSGNGFKDHAGSIDLCLAALSFAYDTLRTGGSFLCKYYQGSEDKAFETQLKALFEKVYRIKPDSSRKESREAYFLALHRKADVSRAQVFPDS